MKSNTVNTLKENRAGELEFFGNPTSELFTREISESLFGVLTKNFKYGPEENLRGFVTASNDNRPWHDTMWSRDAGALLRELVQWGYLEHACLLAGNLLRLVEKNALGFYTFPMYFKEGKPASGSELDGTGAVIIGLVLLWKRLQDGLPVKNEIYDFLTSEESPVKYIIHTLDNYPLVPGSGEFGGGMDVDGEYYNVVQNFLAYYALTTAIGMFENIHHNEFKEVLMAKKEQLLSNISKYLINPDNTWIWCVDTETMKADPGVLNFRTNKGFSGINGVASMYSDVLGFSPLDRHWEYADICINTFDKLLSSKKSSVQFEKYGIYVQFQDIFDGLLSSPAYGQGYAIQTALLFNRPEMAEKLVDFLVNSTFKPPKGYKLDRESNYHFYERLLSPDYFSCSINGGVDFDQGCGALNIVNVAEPLKIARLIAGMDDSESDVFKLVPRLPNGWKGFKATNWPLLSGNSIIKADISLKKEANLYEFEMKFEKPIHKLEIIINLLDGKSAACKLENVDKATFSISY